PQRLAALLRDPAFRQQPGFPHGADADLLRLCDPPFYTACPNPFLAEFAAPRSVHAPELPDGPLPLDLTAGRNDALFNVHAYPTHVPPRALLPPHPPPPPPGRPRPRPFRGPGHARRPPPARPPPRPGPPPRSRAGARCPRAPPAALGRPPGHPQRPR